jgi:hypothetical protein
LKRNQSQITSKVQPENPESSNTDSPSVISQENPTGTNPITPEAIPMENPTNSGQSELNKSISKKPVMIKATRLETHSPKSNFTRLTEVQRTTSTTIVDNIVKKAGTTKKTLAKPPSTLPIPPEFSEALPPPNTLPPPPSPPVNAPQIPPLSLDHLPKPTNLETSPIDSSFSPEKSINSNSPTRNLSKSNRSQTQIGETNSDSPSRPRNKMHKQSPRLTVFHRPPSDMAPSPPPFGKSATFSMGQESPRTNVREVNFDQPKFSPAQTTKSKRHAVMHRAPLQFPDYPSLRGNRTQDDMCINTRASVKISMDDIPTIKTPRNRNRRSSLPNSLAKKLSNLGIVPPSIIIRFLLFETPKDFYPVSNFPKAKKKKNENFLKQSFFFIFFSVKFELEVNEADGWTVGALMQSCESALKEMIPAEGEPLSSPTSTPDKQSKNSIFGRVGKQFKKKTRRFESGVRIPDSPSRRDRDALSPTSPRGRGGKSDFALYWPDKDEWLDESKDIALYSFPDGVNLEYKRRVRDFRLRVQCEITISIPFEQQQKTLLVSPHSMTVADLRKNFIQWINDDANLTSTKNLLLTDPTLECFGLFIKGEWLEEQKLLSSYNIRARSVIHLQRVPAYYFLLKHPLTSQDIPINTPPNSNFQSVINKILPMISHAPETLTWKIDVPKSPKRNFEPHLDLAHALLRSGDIFYARCNCSSVDPQDPSANLTWEVSITRVPGDSFRMSNPTTSRIPAQIQLDGEKIKSGIMDHVTIFQNSISKREILKFYGCLMLTNYRILLERKFQSKENSTTDSWISIPLLSIGNVTKIKAKEKELKKYCLDILGKFSVRLTKLGFVDASQRNSFYDVLLETLADHGEKSLFAFPFSTGSASYPGWSLYSMHNEYARLGILGSNQERFGWRLTKLNEDYLLCKTYPSVLAVPATLSDDVLRIAAGFRTKNRFPVLCWIHPVTGTCLCRSSQPKVGIRGNICKEDQLLLQEITLQGTITSSPATPSRSKEKEKEKKQDLPLRVFDARPLKAAMGNTVMGAGYEGMSAGYKFCQFEFLNIGNYLFINLFSQFFFK